MKELTNNDTISIIYEAFIKEEEFKDFKLLKSKNCFLRKNSEGFDKILFQNWNELIDNEKAFVIEPLYLKRFDILHNWQNKYSFKSITDQKSNPSIFVGGDFFNRPNEYIFFKRTVNIQQFEDIIQDVRECSREFFSKFSTLNDLYSYLIVPIIQEERDFPSHGADWIFEMLILCKLVNPKLYPILKEKILKHIEYMISYNEPNIMVYSKNINMIINELG